MWLNGISSKLFATSGPPRITRTSFFSNVFSIINFITLDVFSVISDGFKTIQFPDDIALIKGISERLIGKFQGVMIRTTPFASCFIYEFDPRSEIGVFTFLSLTQFLRFFILCLISDVTG